MQIYLAAPWFTPTQEDIHDRVLAVLDFSPHRIFSPRRELEVRPDDSDIIQRQAFSGNLRAISGSDMLVAVTDYKDIGTVWECGYAYRAHIPVLYYAETLGDRSFNLMLAQSGIGVVRSTDQLKEVMYLSTLDDIKRCAPTYAGKVQ